MLSSLTADFAAGTVGMGFMRRSGTAANSPLRTQSSQRVGTTNRDRADRRSSSFPFLCDLCVLCGESRSSSCGAPQLHRVRERAGLLADRLELTRVLGVLERRPRDALLV